MYTPCISPPLECVIDCHCPDCITLYGKRVFANVIIRSLTGWYWTDQKEDYPGPDLTRWLLLDLPEVWAVLLQALKTAATLWGGLQRSHGARTPEWPQGSESKEIDSANSHSELQSGPILSWASRWDHIPDCHFVRPREEDPAKPSLDSWPTDTLR